QTNTKNGAGAKNELAAKNPDDMGDGREVVTRRYEFYAYGADATFAPDTPSIDGQNGEAMCDEVDTSDPLHPLRGMGTVTVAEVDGEHTFDCFSVDIVGEYQGSQMGAFNAVAPFSTISDIQSGNVSEAFPQRKVLIGGDTPYATTTSGSLPNGLAIDSPTGVLSGTPEKVGAFQFNVASTDNFGSKVSRDYTLNVTGPGDVNTDFKIDSTDLNTIKARYGQAVLAEAKDPADVNGDLKINLLDYRKAASLCTKPRCAP
ncbi:MAG: putative Ig domain-containing protein, partial [Candidatus Methylumidiphilus sp.]